ncbi:hypothetical protein BJ170DRAFT_681010 [Xylariales sp. AK1849]|nr:hypothetical protein BJ170DRAFT_681010 [Xylariales sp. AK1849]
MSGLCMNRPEGFGPISTLNAPLPTQCFFDTVLVPLPTALYLLSLPVLFFLTPKRARGARRAPKTTRWADWRLHWKHWLLYGAYYFCIGVIVLMESVEIVQLARAGLGVGILPLVYVGCGAAGFLQASDGCFRTMRGFWAASTAFWVGGAAMTVVKMAGLAGLGLQGHLAREGGVYPTVHQFTDLVILAAFYLAAVAAEAGMVVLRRKGRDSSSRDTGEDVVELRSEFDWK